MLMTLQANMQENVYTILNEVVLKTTCKQAATVNNINV